MRWGLRQFGIRLQRHCHSLINLRHIRVVKDEEDFKLQLFSNQGLVSVQHINSLIEPKNKDIY